MMATTTASNEQRSSELFSCNIASAVPCLSSNVGSITDFLCPSDSNNETTRVDDNDNDNEQMKSPSSTMQNESTGELNSSFSKEKLGHRRVDETGTVTYKRVMVDDLIKCLQISLRHVLERVDQTRRQVLVHDFQQVEYQDFPSEGSTSTPAHPYAAFRLKTYAPVAFRFFRSAFRVETSTFVSSLCDQDLKELSNPGASGSIFYISADDVYIIKTVSKKEARFMLGLLPGYYMNLTQNPFTLLPKFFGLFCYQNANKNIRFVVMNNLIPTNVRLHEKYDLKGSIYKRKASDEERKRDLPTLKDNDFKLQHPSGLILEPLFYDQLMQTIQDDVQVLRSFEIMDYSLLLGVHNITKEMKSLNTLAVLQVPVTHDSSQDPVTPQEHLPTYSQYLRVIEYIKEQKVSSGLDSEEIHLEENIDSTGAQTVKGDTSTILDLPATPSVHAHPDQSKTNHPFKPMPIDELFGGDVWQHRQNLSQLAMSGIPAVNEDGDLLLLFVGIIDILQNYRLRKKLEHVLKSTLVTREEVSVCNPNHYGDRFVRFLTRRVFRKRGSDRNTLLSDSQSNLDGMTLHSSKLLYLPASHRSHLSHESSSSSLTNNNQYLGKILPQARPPMHLSSSSSK